jgi:TetR/AcrR family transcriptional regulator, transcriptional repressor for nem operon
MGLNNTAPDKTTRDLIIAAADKLFYEQGFDHTSFAHIADTLGISRGNFYHHFKSKDDILAAVIELRLANTQKMLDAWDADGKAPADRIRSFIRILLVNQLKIMKYGCPVGTLCSELAKLGHPSQSDSHQLFALFKNWLSRQFVLLGRSKEADNLAMHLLARSQGVATLANGFADDKFVQREVQLMEDWLKNYV